VNFAGSPCGGGGFWKRGKENPTTLEKQVIRPPQEGCGKKKNESESFKDEVVPHGEKKSKQKGRGTLGHTGARV